MTLIDLIISTFQTFWNKTIFTNPYHKYTSFKNFIKEVIVNMTFIHSIQKVYGSNINIALWAYNSPAYISMFIALILKRVNIYIIPPRMEVSSVASILISTDSNILIYGNGINGYNINSSLSSYPCYLLAYDMDTEFITYTKNQSIKDLEPIEEIQRSVNNSDIQVQDIQGIIRSLTIRTISIKPTKRDIVVFSSNSESTFPKAVYFHDETIKNALFKLAETQLLPGIYGKPIFSEVDFAIAPVWTILWPLISGSTFAFSMNDANIVIQNNESFERAWNVIAKNLYGKRFLGKIFLKSWATFITKWVFRYKLKRYFNYGTKKDAIIILNAFLAPRVMKTIVGYLPLYTTYGIQETNQIVAINNYSSAKHMDDNCVGEILLGINVDLRSATYYAGEGSLMISTNLLADTVNLEKELYYDTRDHARLLTHNDKLLLFIYGKAKYTITDATFIGANYENLERYLKNVPYFKDVLVYRKGKDELHIIIYPHIDILSIANFGLIDFKNFISGYGSLVNKIYGVGFIKSVKLIYRDFPRTHDGKIKKIFYQVLPLDEEL